MMIMIYALSHFVFFRLTVDARDFSLYEIPFNIEAENNENLAIQRAGLDVSNDHENHPAVVAHLREAMHGGVPAIFKFLQDTNTNAAASMTYPTSSKYIIQPPPHQLPTLHQRRQGRGRVHMLNQPPLSQPTDLRQQQEGPIQQHLQPSLPLQVGVTPGGLRGPQNIVVAGILPPEVTTPHLQQSLQAGVALLQQGSPVHRMLPRQTGIASGVADDPLQQSGVTRPQRQAQPVRVHKEALKQKETPGGTRQQVSRMTQRAPQQAAAATKSRHFDFVVGGFPKCGTTTLLKAFAAHPETDMATHEQCAIAAPVLADAVVLQKLDETLKAMPSVIAGNFSMKRSFKCPTAMYNFKSISRMEKHSPAAKFVVGIRHPVKMMQSFYNYRVTEIYERGLTGTEKIPDIHELLSGNSPPWKGVSMASVRFEIFLQQLGKTTLTAEDFAELSKYTDFGYELAIKPSNFTVFLYTVDQLEDSDATRTGQLLMDLQAYLGLSSPIPPFGHENKNHAVGDAAYPQSISICDPQYAVIRLQLIKNGVQTANWLRDHFLQSSDVVVANPEHFVETLKAWGADPCDGMEESTEDYDGVTVESSETDVSAVTGNTESAPQQIH